MRSECRNCGVHTDEADKTGLCFQCEMESDEE